MKDFSFYAPSWPILFPWPIPRLALSSGGVDGMICPRVCGGINPKRSRTQHSGGGFLLTCTVGAQWTRSVMQWSLTESLRICNVDRFSTILSPHDTWLPTSGTDSSHRARRYLWFLSQRHLLPRLRVTWTIGLLFPSLGRLWYFCDVFFRNTTTQSVWNPSILYPGGWTGDIFLGFCYKWYVIILCPSTWLRHYSRAHTGTICGLNFRGEEEFSEKRIRFYSVCATDTAPLIELHLNFVGALSGAGSDHLFCCIPWTGLSSTLCTY